MLRQVRQFFGSDTEQDDVGAEQVLRQLQEQVEMLRQQQREITRELNEVEVRSGFRQMQIGDELQTVQEKAQKIDEAEQRLQDIAIEEKVDASRLSEQLEMLQSGATDTSQFREQLESFREDVEQRQDALKEDITVIDAAIHDTVEELRDDLVDSFRKEFLALETVMTYEMDALEAKDRWAHENLEDRIDALQESLQEDMADLEAETIGLLKARTGDLEQQLEQRTEELSSAREQLADRVDNQLDELETQVQQELDAIPDMDTLKELLSEYDLEEDIDDVESEITELHDELASIRDTLEAQQEQVDTARTELEDGLDEAVTRVKEEEIQPLRDAVTTVQEHINNTVADLDETVQQQIDQLAQQETADVLRLENRLDRLKDHVEQELAASETVQAARRRSLREDVTDRISEQAEALESVRTGIDTVEERIEQLNTDLSTMTDRVEQMAAAEDLETVQEQVEQLQDDVDAAAAVDTVEQLRQQVESVRDQISVIDDAKADKEAVEPQLESLSTDIVGLKGWMEDSRDALKSQLAELAEETARADTVYDLQDRMEELEGAAARHETVQRKLGEIRDELTSLRDETVSQEEISFMQQRVQKIREQIGPDGQRRVKNEEDQEQEYVPYDRFDELQADVNELAGLVLQLLNREESKE